MNTADKLIVPQTLDITGTPVTISVLILDSSWSMEKYGSTPESAVRGHIHALQKERGRKFWSGVIGFAEEPYIVVPLSPVEEITGMPRYKASGRTRLYDTVFTVLNELVTMYCDLPEECRRNLRVAVGVFSDGEDNLSNKNVLPFVRRMSKLAHKTGFELLTFGIGIDAVRLAEVIGFPADSRHAYTVRATSQGVRDTIDTMTRTTSHLR